ncbi:MAG TPA: DUF1800 domain-containing protein [Micromonosporaceae bacterium]|nr:DUF1800 domain-containing protein [Micromonosporaceae bacterium]
MADREKCAHLLRRAGFGPTAEEVDAAEKAGLAAAIEALVKPAGPDAGVARTPVPTLGPDPYAALGKDASREQKQQAKQARREQIQTITAWWTDRMVAADHQLLEKLVFFWHGHWATSVQKVDSAHLMLAQQEVFRRFGRGDFAPFVKAMLRDAALIFWLDGQRNTRKAPNENLARELMELFTLGIGNYTEEDVKAGARALTGWTIDRATRQVRFEPSRFDDGEKTILGATGRFDADGFADVLTSQPASGRFLAQRLWFRFASGEPMPAEVGDRLVKAYGPGRDVSALLKALFEDSAFQATRSQLVKQPVEWVIGAMRQLGVRPSALTEQESKQFLNGLAGLDQVVFRPPSVGGWPSGTQWLTTFSAQVRLRLAEGLAAKAATANVDRLGAAPVSGRPDALARLLVVDTWTDRTRKVLATAKDPRKMLALGLASPEYAVH